MKRSTAVSHLRMVAEACAEAAEEPPWRGEGGPYVREAWMFGPLLDDPTAEVDRTAVALVLDEPSAAMPWGIEPDRAAGFASAWRLDRFPIWRVHRPRDRLVTNHEIRRPLQLWEPSEGIAEAALDALAAGRVADLARLPEPRAADLDDQLRSELADAEANLETVVDRYDDDAWRRRHSGARREEVLHAAAWAVVDLQRARRRLTHEAPPSHPQRQRP
jgi:hypothetical protein